MRSTTLSSSRRAEYGRIVATAAAVGLVLSTGCARYPHTALLEPGAEAVLLAQSRTALTRRSPDLHLLLTFSGGGTRAAALSYGVLETLADVRLPAAMGSGRLLDEVDAISSVSGGSFTAAYYGLFGDRIFEDFEEKCLRRNLESGLVGLLFTPTNWIRLPSPWFGRGDVAADYYDRILFEGATFDDLWAAGGPHIQIQATDIAQGTTFSFTPEQFELICTDLASFPVARAVAASSSFPVAFTPITIKNHAGLCESQRAKQLRATLAEPNLSRRRYYNAHARLPYLDREARPFIHLMDGGIADNLGLRAPLDLALLEGGGRRRAERVGLDKVRRFAIVVVNAQQPNMKAWSRRDAAPGVVAVLKALGGFQLNRYSFETVDLLERSLQDLEEEYRRSDPTSKGIDTYVIEVNLADVQRGETGGGIPFIPTRLSLSKETTNQLRAIARRLLTNSPEFQRLIHDLGGEIRPEPAIEQEASAKG